MTKLTKPGRTMSPGALHILSLGGTLSWLATEVMDPPVSPSYISRALSGREPMSDRLFSAFVEVFGADEAITLREMAAEARAGYPGSEAHEKKKAYMRQRDHERRAAAKAAS